MELAFLPEEAEYTDSTERVLVASVISVTQNQLFLWILPTYPGTYEPSLILSNLGSQTFRKQFCGALE